MAISLIDPSTAESSPHVLIHPIVLLTINDHCTRSSIRHHGPVIGALLGRHDGKSIVVEQAFECGSRKLNVEAAVSIDAAWFARMIKLQGEIYPDLVLMGWYTFGRHVQPAHLSIQAQFRQGLQCESPIMLLFRGLKLDTTTSHDSLPFDVFESYQSHGHEGHSMDIDNAETVDNKFRPVSHFLDTPAEEAIGLADIVQSATAAQAATEYVARKQSANGTLADTKVDGLLPEDDELLSALVRKADAIKMLQSRLGVIEAYLHAQPDSYLTDASLAPEGGPDHEVLRAISTLAASLTSNSPSGLTGYTQGSNEARTDAHVVQLLSQLTQSVGEVKTLGRHMHAADARKRRDGTGLPSGMSQLLDTPGSDWT